MARNFRCLLIVALLALSGLLFCDRVHANMAEPWQEGTAIGALQAYGAGNCSVAGELIHMKLLGVGTGRALEARFTVTYNIKAAQQTLPLLFIGKELKNAARVTVNGTAVTIQIPDSATVRQLPFIKFNKTLRHYYTCYRPGDTLVVDLHDLVFFKAPLADGENKIMVEYVAEAATKRFGVMPDFTFYYSLYPSRFWKSFGPVRVELEMGRDYELTGSNLSGVQANGTTLTWNVRNLKNDIQIKVNPRLGPVKKAVVKLGAMGIALLCFLALSFGHIWLLKLGYSRWLLWLGILVVPLAGYFVFFTAHKLIIQMVRGARTYGDYVGLVIITWPIAALLYGIMVSIISRRWRRAKTVRQDTQKR